MFICVILYLFIVVYAVILSGGSEISVFHAIYSQVPSLILSAAVWLFKRWFLKKEKENLADPKTPERSSNEENTSEAFSNEETTSTSSRWPINRSRKQRGLQLQAPSDYGTLTKEEIL